MRRCTIFLLVSFAVPGYVHSFLDDLLPSFLTGSTPAKEKKEAGFLFSEQGFWIKKKDEVEKQSADFNELAQRVTKDITQRKEKVDADIELVKKQIADHSSRALRAKLALLEARYMRLDAVQEQYDAMTELYHKELVLSREMIEASKPQETQTTVLYTTLNEVRGTEDEIAKCTQEYRGEKRNIERLDKQKKLELERRTELDREIAVTKEALVDPAIAARVVAQLFDGEDVSLSKNEREELLNIHFAILNEQRELVDATVRRLEVQLQYSQDRLMQYDRQVKELRRSLQTAETLLRVTQADVDGARIKLDEERRLTDENIKNIGEQIVGYKARRDTARSRREALEGQRRLHKELGQNDAVQDELLEARLTASAEQINEIMREIDLAEYFKRIELEKIAKSMWQFRYVELRWKMQNGDFDLGHMEAMVADLRKEARKQQDELEVLGEEQKELSHQGVDLQRRKELIEKQAATLLDGRASIYKNRPRELKEVEVALDAARRALLAQASSNPREIAANLDLCRLKKEITAQLDLMIKMLEGQRRFDMWQRVPTAIEWDVMIKALNDAERFMRNFFAHVPYVFTSTGIVSGIERFAWQDYVHLVAFVALFILLFWLLRFLIRVADVTLRHMLAGLTARGVVVIGIVGQSAIAALQRYYIPWVIWLFIIGSIWLSTDSVLHPLHTTIQHFDIEYVRWFIATFYLFSIPLLVVMVHAFIEGIIAKNRREGYPLVSAGVEEKFKRLLVALLYGAAIALPACGASSAVRPTSPLSTLIFAIYSIVVQVSLLTFILSFREILVGWISDQGVMGRIRGVLVRHYTFFCVFLVTVVILSNKYVGYKNLAVKLLYLVPLSVIIIYGLFVVHYYVRKYSAFWFITEEEGEVVGRFEYAKTYYGIFIILTFLALLVCTLVCIGWMWGFSTTFERVYFLLSEEWTVPVGPQKRLGIIQFITLVVFVVFGFLTATLLDNFVMSKIFDVLRMDPGIRNTVSSILNYVVVYVIVVLGLNYIQLGEFVFWVSGIFALGIGMGARPFLEDIIAGFWVLIERPIEIGSFVETSGFRGTVQKISARATTIRTFHNHLVVVPNKELITRPITNWGYGRSTVGFDLRVPVAYDANPELVKEVLAKVVQTDPRILRIPAVIYRLDDFVDLGMIFLIRPFISARRVREQWDIAGELRMKIYQAFREHGIRIPYPHRIVYFAGNQAGTPGGEPPFSTMMGGGKPPIDQV